VRSLTVWAAVLETVLVAAPATAATTTWEIEGIVRDYWVAGPAPFPAAIVALGIQDGTPFSASLVFDDSLPDTSPFPNTATYAGSLFGGGLTAGSLTYDITLGQLTTGLHRVGDVAFYRITTDLGGAMSSEPDLIGHPFILVDLADTGQDVITSEAFPSPLPDLSDFDPYPDEPFMTTYETSVRFGFYDPGSGFAAAEITSLEVVATPEPGTLTLMALGLALAVRPRTPRQSLTFVLLSRFSAARYPG
jgi:hypothetical protein